MQIEIWCAFCQSITAASLLERYRALLSLQERAQQERFHFARDRHRYLITRALLRTTLSRYADIPPQSWTFAPNAYGRPAISNDNVNARAISFNLSHTSELVVLAIARDRQIGVDTEDALTRRAPVEIAERFFAAAEVASLRALAPDRQRERFFQLWTLKESYIKARGMGLSLPLEQFAFHFPRPQALQLTIEPQLQDDPQNWRFWQWWVEPRQAHLPAQTHLQTPLNEAPQRQHMLALCAQDIRHPPQRIILKEIVPLASEGEARNVLIACSDDTS